MNKNILNSSRLLEPGHGGFVSWRSLCKLVVRFDQLNVIVVGQAATTTGLAQRMVQWRQLIKVVLYFKAGWDVGHALSVINWSAIVMQAYQTAVPIEVIVLMDRTNRPLTLSTVISGFEVGEVEDRSHNDIVLYSTRVTACHNVRKVIGA